MSASPSSRERFSLAVDVVMLVLIIANLTLIIVDWTFESSFVQRQLQAYVPAAYQWYNDTIHQHFLLYDLAFVAVFATEIVIRWGLAIYRQTYYRWFFYPFARWYDVLGCIPVGSLRSLRLLRIISMIPKMQRLGIVDLRQTAVYATFVKYRDIAFEEITDRVTVRVLEGVQNEIRHGNPVTEQIVEEVVKPQRDRFFESVVDRFQEATSDAYGSYRDDFQDYVREVIADAVDRNQEIRTIASIPGVGSTVSNLLERAISDITFNVLNRMMADIAAPENNEVVTQITAISSDALLADTGDDRLNRLTRSVLLQSIDVIKDHVQIQQWKLEDGVRPEAARRTPRRRTSPIVAEG